MKKILMSLVTVALMASVTVAATRAWFSSTQTISGNTLSSGTLTIGLTGNEAETQQTFDLGEVGNMEPGDITETAVIEIENTGSLNLLWFGYFNFGGNQEMLDKVYIEEAKMEFLNPTGGTWQTEDQFIAAGVGSGSYPTYYNQLAAADPIGKISLRTWNNANAMGAGGGVQIGALKPDYKYRMSFKLGFDESADNYYQGKSLSMSYTTVATQVNKEAMVELQNGNTRLLDNPFLWGTSPNEWFVNQISKQ